MQKNYFVQQKDELASLFVSARMKNFEAMKYTSHLLEEAIILEDIFVELVDASGGIENLNISDSSKEKLLKLDLFN